MISNHVNVTRKKINKCRILKYHEILYQQKQKDFNYLIIIVPFISWSSLKLKIKGHKTAKFFFDCDSNQSKNVIVP